MPVFKETAGKAVVLGAGNCNGDAACRDDFYSDPMAVGYYKDHVKRIVTRVNTFNGRTYRHGPCHCLPSARLQRGQPKTSRILMLYQIGRSASETQTDWGLAWSKAATLAPCVMQR